MSDAIEILSQAAVLMEMALTSVTGLKPRDLKLVIYWTLATHALPWVSIFPLLVLMGKMGTGKSQTLEIIKRFAHRPRAFSLRGRTLPVIRDELEACSIGTAIIEEADQAWKDDVVFERMLSDRYQRASAEAALKEDAGHNRWVTVIKRIFGATALHRRIPFNDAAVNGRSVFVHFKADHSRTYEEFNEQDVCLVEGERLLRNFTFQPIPVEQPTGVAARVFNTHKILLVVAKLIGDEEFPLQIQDRLLLETAELKEAQSVEPDGLVLRALIEAISTPAGFHFRNVKIGALTQAIFNNHRVWLQPYQVGAIARQLGFETKNSHGVRVVVPTPVALLKACDECGYDDEAIMELKKQITGPERGWIG